MVVAEIPVTWQVTPPENPPPGFNPVFLFDGLGIRTAVFVRCARCGSPCGIGPVAEGEQEGWNSDPPKINLMFDCNACKAVFLITGERAWMLTGLPIPVSPRTLVDIQIPSLL
jgi:hypothetical protein